MKKASVDSLFRKSEHILKSDEKLLSAIVLFLAFLLGIIVRWNFVAESDFPINDGGFFYSMISDLIASNFSVRLSIQEVTYQMASCMGSHESISSLPIDFTWQAQPLYS